MRLRTGLATAVASTILSLTALFSPVTAHSQARNPISHLARVEDIQILTPSQRVHAHSSFDLQFSIQDRNGLRDRIRLSLEPNHDILSDDAVVTYIDGEGNVQGVEPIQRHEHRVFKGKTWMKDGSDGWKHVGWARIVVKRDGSEPLFEGAFVIRHDHHHVQLRTHYMQTRHWMDPVLDEEEDVETMIVYRDSDVRKTNHVELRRSGFASDSCNVDQLSFNIDPRHPVYDTADKRDPGMFGAMSFGSLLGKRQSDVSGSTGNSAGVNLTTTIGQTSGCPTTRKVALIGVAADCTYTGSFNSTDSARSNIITQVNTASDIYESTFNVTLGLRNLTISTADCPGTAPAATPWNLACSDNTTLTDRLNLFSAWRGEHNDTNAYWTLLTDCSTGSEVGLAWLGQLCTTGVSTATSSTGGTSESVAGANVVARTSNEWQVIAHESGHTFGAVHDCTSSTCSDGTTVASQQCCPLSTTTCDANGAYIMNPSSNDGVDQFSPCTIGNVCSALLRNSVKSTCLSDNKGVTTITGNQCGNGIVEEGEECDCGGTDGCGSNTCCDPSTCKFTSGSVCDDANDDCCTSCQFTSSGTVCRASTGVCDPEETCSGSSASCPEDATAQDGTSCGTSLECASGQCTSRDEQCMTLMTSYTASNDTYACDSSSCTIKCTSPSLGSGVCYEMQQNFLDGTSCSGGGKCYNGACKGSSTSKEVLDWIDTHKPLVIGICVTVGVLLLLSLISCIYRRLRAPKKIMPPPPGHRRRRSRHGHGERRGHRNLPSEPVVGYWNGPMPPQQQYPMQMQEYGPPPYRNQWTPPPPPGYGGHGGRGRYA